MEIDQPPAPGMRKGPPTGTFRRNYPPLLLGPAMPRSVRVSSGAHPPFPWQIFWGTLFLDFLGDLPARRPLGAPEKGARAFFWLGGLYLYPVGVFGMERYQNLRYI
jgi:hypothetical protein